MIIRGYDALIANEYSSTKVSILDTLWHESMQLIFYWIVY